MKKYVLSSKPLWNTENDWPGLWFQTARLTKTVDLSLLRVITSIGEQAGYLSPWLFVPLSIVWVRALNHGT